MQPQYSESSYGQIFSTRPRVATMDDYVSAGLRAVIGAIENAVRASDANDEIYQPGQFGTPCGGAHLGGYAHTVGVEREDYTGTICVDHNGEWTLTFAVKPVPHGFLELFRDAAEKVFGDAWIEEGIVKGEWRLSDLKRFKAQREVGL